jgi:hypothetical protein
MPQVGFEPTIPVFERAKTVHASDGAATVIDHPAIRRCIFRGVDSVAEQLVVVMMLQELESNVNRDTCYRKVLMVFLCPSSYMSQSVPSISFPVRYSSFLLSSKVIWYMY